MSREPLSSKGMKFPTKPTRRQLLEALGRIQDLVGSAKSAAMDDKNPNRIEKTVRPLEEAFDLCVEAAKHDPPVS